MKTYRLLFNVIPAALALLSVQSCLKDQTEIFETSPSKRMQVFLGEVNNTLVSSEQGWLFEYYPGEGQKYGGYTYHLTFNAGGKVTARFELEPGESETSYYKLCADSGPVLSFDTGNEILQHFATPSSFAYEAMGGDFEFVIRSRTDDVVEMVGKRSGNFCTLRRYNETVTPDTYLAEVAAMSETVKAAIVEGTIGNLGVVGDVDLNNRRIVFSHPRTAAGDSVTVMPFRFTPEGIRAYRQMSMGGCRFQDISYLAKNNIFTNGVFSLQGRVPENYVKYDDFPGRYELVGDRGSASLEVALRPDETGNGFLMSGLHPSFDVFLNYDKARGYLKWYTQKVGENGMNSIMLCPMNDMLITWSLDAGMIIYLDLATGLFKFRDNGEYENGFGAHGFILWEFDQDNNSVGENTGMGYAAYPYLESMKKIGE